MKKLLSSLLIFILTAADFTPISTVFIKSVSAQNSPIVTSRLTIPIASNTTLVVEKGSDGTETKHILVQDHLGSTRMIITEDGTVVKTLSYYPYGMFYDPGSGASFDPGSSVTNRYYTNQRKVSSDDSLYNYNARYYNPDIAHFTQPDSVEGPNRYAYVDGNPIMKNDPSGEMAINEGGKYSKSSDVYDLNSLMQFATPRQAYQMSPDQGISDTVYHASIAGIAAIGGGVIAAEYGPPIALWAFTTCMANVPGCISLGADLVAGPATGGTPIAPVPRGVIGRFWADESGQVLPPQHLNDAARALNLTELYGSDHVVSGGVALIDEERIGIREVLDRVFSLKGLFNPREVAFTKAYYGLDKIGVPRTYAEIAEEHGVSSNYIRQVVTKAIRKLRHPILSRVLDPYDHLMNKQVPK